MKRFSKLVFFLVIVFALFGCLPKPKPNSAPVITSTSPDSPVSVQVGKSVVLSVTASDPDTDRINYAWSATKGALSSQSGTSVTWTAPATAGTAQVIVSINDGKATTKYTWNINVTADPGYIAVEQNITTPTTFEANKIYLLNSINLSSTLTIEAGAIVKFKEGAKLFVDLAGSITANGTSDKPIFFTSSRDDYHGGDTNKDGANSTPRAGDWVGIELDEARLSTFNYCHFLYAGNTSSYDAALGAYQAKAEINNCLFAYNNSSSTSALDLGSALDGSFVRNTVFHNNIKPLTIGANINIDDSNTFHNPEKTTEKNTQNGVYFITYSPISTAISWAETEVPFVFMNSFVIDQNATLTLSPGVVCKFGQNVDINVRGSLKANGTADKPIYFTSLLHDILSDTNGDGSNTTPAAANWRNITLYQSPNLTNEFSYCYFMYGGSDGSYDGVLNLYFSNAKLNNCTFAYSNGANVGALNASKALATEINSCTFFGNIKPLVINDLVTTGLGNRFSDPKNSSITNTKNGIFVAEDCFTVEEQTNWLDTAVPYVIEAGLEIAKTGKLTLGSSAILKFVRDTSFTIYGTNLVHPSVVFTAFSDDSRGGDTNGDGQSVGSAGYWDGIYDDQAGSYVSWSTIYFAANCSPAK